MRSDDWLSVLDKRGLLLACGSVQGLLLVILAVESAGISTSILRPVVAVAALTFVPGLMLTALLGVEDVGRAIAYSIGLSMMTNMVVGGIISLIFPAFGVESPLTVWIYAPTLSVVVAGIGVVVAVTVDDYELPIHVRRLASPTPLALALLPLLSILGTFAMYRTQSNTALLALIVLVSLIPLSLALRDWLGDWKPLAIWSLSLTLVYHGSLGPFSGGHQLSQLTLDLGRWFPNYADGIGSLLANGVLYPSYAMLGGVTLGVEWGVVNPFLISFLPAFLYLIFKTQTGETHAFLAACLFMFAFPFYTLYTGGGRVSTPVFFLALVGLALTDQSLPRERRVVLALAFVPGISVSHYGTAWVVLFGFFVSITVLAGFYLRDAYADADGRYGGRSQSSDVFETTPEWVRSTFLTPMFVTYYCVFSLGWYLYTGLGGKFKTLPNHVVGGLAGLLFEDGATGGAVRSATKDYGSTAVAVSRWLYILFGALMALGITITLLYRLYGHRQVEDEFLALGTGFLSLLGASFLPFSKGFNTARVMMIVFVFTAPFAIIGLAQLASRAGAYLETTDDFLSSVGTKSSVSVVGILLAVFLLLNTGIVSATVTDDFAPSNSLLRQQLLDSEDPVERTKATECVECNVQVHAWAFKHITDNQTLYGDDIAEAQIDYYRGRLTEQIGEVPRGARYEPLWLAQSEPDGGALMVVLPHNDDTGGVFYESKYDWRPYDELSRQFDRAHRIYDGQKSAVYRTLGTVDER